MTDGQDDEIPYFIKIRGCINCDASKELKKRRGHDYGFDHEIVAGCVILGCVSYGFNLAGPFYDPEEVVRLAKKDGRPEIKENARKYCLGIKENFGKFYDELGVSINDILNKL